MDISTRFTMRPPFRVEDVYRCDSTPHNTALGDCLSDTLTIRYPRGAVTRYGNFLLHSCVFADCCRAVSDPAGHSMVKLRAPAFANGRGILHAQDRGAMPVPRHGIGFGKKFEGAV